MLELVRVVKELVAFPAFKHGPVIFALLDIETNRPLTSTWINAHHPGVALIDKAKFEMKAAWRVIFPNVTDFREHGEWRRSAVHEVFQFVRIATGSDPFRVFFPDSFVRPQRVVVAFVTIHPTAKMTWVTRSMCHETEVDIVDLVIRDGRVFPAVDFDSQ